MFTDTRQEALEQEINKMEQAILGNPEETVKEPTETQESQPFETAETATETATETEVIESAPEAITHNTEQVTEEASEEAKKKRNDWKKRYVNYKASTDSTLHQQRQEILRFQETNLDLSKQVDSLAKQVAELSTKEFNASDLVSQEQREIVGEETLDVLNKLNKAALESQVNPLKAQLESEKQQRLEAAELKLKEDKEAQGLSFIQKLAGIMPDYAEIDANPQFINWMSEAEPDSGLTRKYIFKQAQTLGDVGRVAGFMREFKQITKSPERVLESQITPTKEPVSPQPNTQVTNEKTIWTTKGIDAFYDDVIRGKFRGTNKERLAFERDIDLAIQEGRVR